MHRQPWGFAKPLAIGVSLAYQAVGGCFFSHGVWQSRPWAVAYLTCHGSCTASLEGVQRQTSDVFFPAMGVAFQTMGGCKAKHSHVLFQTQAWGLHRQPWGLTNAQDASHGVLYTPPWGLRFQPWGLAKQALASIPSRRGLRFQPWGVAKQAMCYCIPSQPLKLHWGIVNVPSRRGLRFQPWGGLVCVSSQGVWQSMPWWLHRKPWGLAKPRAMGLR